MYLNYQLLNSEFISLNSQYVKICDFNENGVLDTDENPTGSQTWWNLTGPEYTWLCLDPTWNVAFQSTPSWLQAHEDNGITDFTGRMTYYILSKPPDYQ